MNQHSKLKQLFADGEWHCKNEIRGLYIFNAHKRMIEIEGRRNKTEKPMGKFIFKDKPCEHGVQGQRDYLMVENADYVPPKPLTSDQILRQALL